MDVQHEMWEVTSGAEQVRSPGPLGHYDSASLLVVSCILNEVLIETVDDRVAFAECS